VLAPRSRAPARSEHPTITYRDLKPDNLFQKVYPVNTTTPSGTLHSIQVSTDVFEAVSSASRAAGLSTDSYLRKLFGLAEVSEVREVSGARPACIPLSDGTPVRLTYRGVTHTLTVSSGFLLLGGHLVPPSRAAREVTGAQRNWNGWRNWKYELPDGRWSPLSSLLPRRIRPGAEGPRPRLRGPSNANEILRREYGKTPTRVLASDFGWTPAQVRSRAQSLGLGKPRQNLRLPPPKENP